MIHFALKPSTLGVLAITACFSVGTLAASASEPLSQKEAIKGNMKIDFKSRVQLSPGKDLAPGSAMPGVRDVYTLDLTVAETTAFQGKIERQPRLVSATIGNEKQPGGLIYDVGLSLKNPQNLAQVKAVGKWTGSLSIDGSGVYHLDQPLAGSGAMRLAVDAVGAVQGFSTPFEGDIRGREIKKHGLMAAMDKAKSDAMTSYQRYVNGKKVAISVKNADPMKFVNTLMAKGPVAIYPDARVNGAMDFDPETGNWYLQLTMDYSAEGQKMADKISGTVKWNEDPQRKQNGMGWYDFNVRWNEDKANPPKGEAAAFQPTSDESAFFAVDATVPSVTGRADYKDRFKGETVVASEISYRLDANQLSKVQILNFAKLLMLVVGPFNDE
ncbi:MAG: hypothetical protein WCP34_06080 [Pseudomonadota bacterium]